MLLGMNEDYRDPLGGSLAGAAAEMTFNGISRSHGKGDQPVGTPNPNVNGPSGFGAGNKTAGGLGIRGACLRPVVRQPIPLQDLETKRTATAVTPFGSVSKVFRL